MFRCWSLLFILVFGLSCQSTFRSDPSEQNKTQAWAEFEDSFFKDLWALYPGWASSMGLRQYDSQMRVPNQLFFEQQKSFLQKYMAQLDGLQPSMLKETEQVDYRLVKTFLQSTLWELNEFKSFQWDPSKYNVGSSLALIMESQVEDPVKILNLKSRLQIVPEFYKAAYLNIDRPTQEHLNLAIQQNKGTLVYLENTILPYLKSQLGSENLEVLTKARESVSLYVAQLEKLNQQMRKKNSYRSFRIGEQKYRKKFELDLQVNASPESVYKHALSEKSKSLEQMIQLSEKLWAQYFPGKKKPRLKKEMVRQLVQRLSENHVAPDQFLQAVQEQIPQLWSFVQKKKLMDLDSSKVLKVRTTPEYEQGFSVASIDAPGPFEPQKETFYNVMPLQKMSSEKAESFLREYNEYTLQILNIHEAIPGHYVQLVYSKKTPSLVKTIFGNGTMVEGWAVYTERMMLENGYGDDKPELWLMYYKWYLRVVCNTILDYEIHNKNLSKAAGLKLLMEDAFQEKTEAEMKWERATYSQVQLASYFSGFSEIYRFREELRKQGSFDLKSFHERFLSYGSAPIRDIITLMAGPTGTVKK